MRAGARAGILLAMAAVMVMSTVTWVLNQEAAAAPSLATGFSRVAIPTGIPGGRLVNFVFLPGGDILAVGKCGEIRRVAETGGSVALPSLPVNCDHDRGLLGFDLAPDFESSRRVYTLYNYGGPTQIRARLSRWTVDNATTPTVLTGEQIILDGLPSFSATGASCDNSHTIGTVLAAPDGTLYVGNGEAASYCSVDATALQALDITSPRGKIFRVNPDGTGVSTNPFYEPANPTSWPSRVFAYGVRNPFRFGLRPESQAVYLGDVGWNSHEEVNVATGAGENFGWPCWEGPLNFRNNYQTRAECQTAYQSLQPTAPLHSWPHAGSDAAAVGGVFYEGDTYPADYHGAFFFGDYAQSRIWTMRTNAGHQIVRAPEANGFGSDIGAPVAFRSGPNGDVFYADIASSNIYRLRYAPGNREPMAHIITDRTAGAPPLTVAFDGRDSHDLDDEPLQYAWAFGDGATAAGPQVSHTYAAGGPYTARLTVTDQLGASGTATVQITPGNNPPVLTVTGPGAQTFAVGDPVQVSATATDPEDGPLPASSIMFTSTQQHCPYGGSCHMHPGPITGETVAGGTWSAAFPDHGDDSHLELMVTATDSRGATTNRLVTLPARTRTLRLSSDPPGVPLAMNSSDSNAFPAFELVVGSDNSITAPAEHLGLRFVGWSDAGQRDRRFTMPDQDVNLVAHYEPIPEPPAPPGRVLALGFNEGSGSTTADASGNGLHGTLLNAPSWVAAGRYGAALDFDGSDDMVRVADAAPLDLTNAFTIAAWVRPDHLNGWQTLAMKSTASGLAYGLYGSGFGNPRGAAFVDTGASERFVRATTPLSTTSWQHFAVTYDGATARFYINGAAAGTSPLPGPAITSNQPLFIGGNTVWSDEDYQGLIDELQIYNRALTATEITTIKDTAIG